jgi:hypothetical protein
MTPALTRLPIRRVVPRFWLPRPIRKHAYGTEANIGNNFAALRARLRRLPPIHQTTFQAIIEHLGRVQSRSASNKMDAKVRYLDDIYGAPCGEELDG